jgi:uncharacterized protein YkwD
MTLASSFRAVSLALPLALAACNGGTTVPNGPTQANPITVDPERVSAIQQLNTIRAMAGVSQVAVCSSLNVSASAHSDDMRDNGYLAEISPITGTNVSSRACAAAYAPACGSPPPMGELVAEGYFSGIETVTQWQMDPTSQPILVKPGMVVAGVGRSQGAQNVYWTLDLSSAMDPSCN